MSDTLQLIGTVDAQATDRVVLVRHTDGTWVLGVGYSFPATRSYPVGAVFWRVDLQAFYYWNGSSWTAISTGGGSLTVKEADGAPSVAATQLQFDSADGLVVTDLGGGVARIDLSGIPGALLGSDITESQIVNLVSDLSAINTALAARSSKAFAFFMGG